MKINDYSDEETVAKTRYIEDDVRVLKEIEREIDNLLKQRIERLEIIRQQHSINDSMIQDSHRWFANNVVGVAEASMGMDNTVSTRNGDGRY